MNLSFLLLGFSSLFFGLWTAYGLHGRSQGTFPGVIAQRKRWFGVCADFSETVIVPVIIVRLFVLFYTPIGLGPVFCFIYYLVIRNKVPIQLKFPERNLLISKLKATISVLRLP